MCCTFAFFQALLQCGFRARDRELRQGCQGPEEWRRHRPVSQVIGFWLHF